MASYTYSQFAQYFSLPGTSKNDKHSINVTGKRVSFFYDTYAFGNTLSGGDGKDNLSISAKHSNDSFVYQNVVDGGNDADKVKLSVTSKFGVADMQYNDIDMGEGKNSIQLSAKSGIGRAHIKDNVIVGGDDVDSLKLTASSKGYPIENTSSVVGGNTIETESGDDKISIAVKSKIQNAMIGEDLDGNVGNTIDSGDGDDSLKLTVQNSGIITQDTFFASGVFGVFDVGTGARLKDNVIDTGGGDDELDISAKSGIGPARIRDNAFQGGDGNNEFDFSSQNKGAIGISQFADTGSLTETYSTFSADISENTIETGGDDDAISLSAKSSKGSAFIGAFFQPDGVGGKDYSGGNTISAGDGDNLVELSASTSGSIVRTGQGAGATSEYVSGAIISENEITAGSGNDLFSVAAKSNKTIALIEENDIDSGSGDDVIEFDVKSKVVKMNLNTITGGAGDDVVEIASKTKNSDYLDGGFNDNMVFGGDGDDLIALDLKSDLKDLEIQEFLENNTIDGGAGDTDTLQILSKKQTIDLTSIGTSHLENIEVLDLGKSKSSLFLDDSSVISATDGRNLLLVTGKGSSVEFNGGTLIDTDNGFSYFDLGTSTVGVEDGVKLIELSMV